MVGLVVLLVAYMVYIMIAVDMLIVLLKFRKEFDGTIYNLIALCIYSLIFIVLEIPKLIISCIVGAGIYTSIIVMIMWILIFLFQRIGIKKFIAQNELPQEILLLDVTTTRRIPKKTAIQQKRNIRKSMTTPHQKTVMYVKNNFTRKVVFSLLKNHLFY